MKAEEELQDPELNTAPEADTEQAQQEEPQEQPTGDEATEEKQEETPETIIEKLQEQVAHEKKEYLFLMAEFDNYRKRTLQEKADLIKSAAGRALVDLLPVVDDFERAVDAMEKTDDIQSMKEGIMLIYNKFIKYLESQHVKPIESTGQPFDTDLHEAITMFPAPSDDMKGKVVDTTLKGYMINDKVLRHAKVVVGQ
ncbi:MAG: nucleotide exchange factor GrpE [Muribaculaceae bacterium]|nr:nucleotide exchange factor GrpE [Muribaculaceae bacterium]